MLPLTDYFGGKEMCTPSAAVAGAGAVAGIIQQGAQQRAQARMAEAQAEAAQQRAEAAQEAHRIDQQQLDRREREVDLQAMDEMEARRREQQREQSLLRVGFGDANVMGPSTLRQLHATTIQAAEDTARIEGQHGAELGQIDAQRQATHATATGRIQQEQTRTDQLRTQKTGPLGRSMSIGTAGVQGGLTGYQAGRTLFDR